MIGLMVLWPYYVRHAPWFPEGLPGNASCLDVEQPAAGHPQAGHLQIGPPLQVSGTIPELFLGTLARWANDEQSLFK